MQDRSIEAGSAWSEGEDRKWRKEKVARLPGIQAEIDGLIAEIVHDVARLPPLQVLVCARRFSDVAWSGLETEAESGEDQIHAQHMVEYLQSLVAAVPRAPRQNQQLTEEDWKQLSARVKRVFKLVTYDFLPWLDLTSAEGSSGLDSDAEFIEFELRTFWLNVRGKRYYAHVPRYLRDVFVPHTDVLGAAFGLSGEEFVKAFESKLRSFLFGLRDAVADLRALWRDVSTVCDDERTGDITWNDVDSLSDFEAVIEEQGWSRRLEAVRGRLVGADLYDVEHLTKLPRKLLDELSWSPGEAAEFLESGDYSGWPVRVLPVFSRPFIRLDDSTRSEGWWMWLGSGSMRGLFPRRNGVGLLWLLIN